MKFSLVFLIAISSLLGIASPAAVMCLMSGQSSFLTAALICGGIHSCPFTDTATVSAR